jgi:hypothetical protein
MHPVPPVVMFGMLGSFSFSLNFQCDGLGPDKLTAAE